MIKNLLIISILALSLSACAQNETRPMADIDDEHTHEDHHKDEYGDHDHDDYYDKRSRRYNGYPYDRGYRRSGASIGFGIGSGSRSGVSTGIGIGFGL